MAGSHPISWVALCLACASAASRTKCSAPDLSAAAAAQDSGFAIGEKYVDLVACGELRLLASRLQPNMRTFEWVTLARTWEGDQARDAGTLLPPEWHMSHNTAFVCVNGTLHAFGGQYRNSTGGRGEHARGIAHAAASLGGLPRWSEPTVQIAGYTGRCIERRR